ncbi:MAG TPA: NAD(P)-dependent oxidoreductase [Ktedonobacteraceae bacterium]
MFNLKRGHEKAPAKRQILLTGAAGAIGSAFFEHAAAMYTFRLADRVLVNFAGNSEERHKVIQLDVSDLESCQQACQGIDTVVHLAADPNPDADFTTSLLSNNIQGTYNILRAAKDQGCSRVVLASSIQVVLGYEPDVQTNLSSAPRPMNMYGVSKCFAENAASYFAHAEGLSCIAVRIGAYDARNDHAEWLRKCPHPLAPAAYVSPRDMNQLLTRCIDVPDVPFAIVHGISNNRFKRVDLTSTCELLGYQPEDDAFTIFQ